MELIRDFKQLNKGDAILAGGKGASLGELAQAGIPVPPGFVVLADSFERFIQETDLVQEIDAILGKVHHKEIHTVETASEYIKELILSREMPADIATLITEHFKKLDTEFVAVRSSATAEDGAEHAWAGQLESYLNTTEAEVLDKVKHCWASLFTPRAIFYRFEKGLHATKISVAVVIQKMVASEVSGIAFSVHPITEDHNQLIIEAGFGLGEAIVSGSITPDSYVVEKNPRRIIDINVNTQTKALHRQAGGGNVWQDIREPQASSQVLTEQQILELAELVIKIENHYGFPCDIEWAYEAGKFYIVQSRPITTLSSDVSKVKRQTVSGPNPNDYIRMFAGKSFLYIFSDIFLQYYGPLGVIVVQDQTGWMSFFPKAMKEKTLEEGKELYTSGEKYRQYSTEFHDYMQLSSEHFASILEKDKVTTDEVEEYLELAGKHFSYYSKTEFFYTDLLDQKNMALSVQEFDKLKLEGRSYLNKVFFEQDGAIQNLVKKISTQTGVVVADLLRYNIAELLELIKTGKRLGESVVHGRDIFFDSAALKLFGEEAKQLVAEFLFEYRHVSDVIKGTIANKGKVRGRARVLVPDFADFSKIAAAVEEMREGEILVAETTAPEIIKACKKAAAIVTNQGGMLSHAAIISRELGIPCIIGTDKDVTLNIKTGDEVEVDADKGIVKILK